jgi:hypothetical protein
MAKTYRLRLRLASQSPLQSVTVASQSSPRPESGAEVTRTLPPWRAWRDLHKFPNLAERLEKRASGILPEVPL